MLQQSHVPLTNGIMSFLQASEDYDLAPIGIGSMHEQAQKLAEFGRHGDIYFVHAAEGETVIPLEVLNANPKVKDMLFNQMREMGLDPDEFVVGNELNSINPVTGMPEFFFSSVWRGAKRAASSVWQGVRKAAPYVVPLVLSIYGVPGAAPGSMFGAGSFGAAFLGGGVGSLMAGKSMKESLRNAAIAGGTSALVRGVSNINEPGGFTGGVGRSFGVGEGGLSVYGDPYEPGADVDRWGRITEPTEPIGPTYPSVDAGDLAIGPGGAPISRAPFSTQPPPSSLIQRPLPEAQTDFSSGFAGRALGTRARAAQAGRGLGSQTARIGPKLTQVAQGLPTGLGPGAAYWGPPAASVPTVAPGSLALDPSGAYAASRYVPPVPAGAGAGADVNLRAVQAGRGLYPPARQEKTFLEKVGTTYDEYVGKYLQGGKTDPEWAAAQRTAGKEAAALADDLEITGAQRVLMIRDARKAAGKGLWEYGPLAAYSGVAYGASKLFEGESAEDERLRKIKEKEAAAERAYKASYAIYGEDPGKYYVDLGLPPAALVAQGGLAEYPRRDLLVEGQGTERSDDIPAMLSDGEFVMNAESVRGADPSGRGNRYAGANNLYNMMRNFEMRT